MQPFNHQSLALHHAQYMRQLVNADAKFGVNMAHADFFIAPRHQMRIDAQTNRHVFMIQAPVFQHGNSVNVDFYPQRNSLVKFINPGKIGGVQNVLRRITGQNTQTHLLNGYTIQPSAPFAKQLHHRQISQRLASIMNMYFWVRKGSCNTPILTFHYWCIIYVKRWSIFFTKIQRVNTALKLIFAVYKFHASKWVVECINCAPPKAICNQSVKKRNTLGPQN